MAVLSITDYFSLPVQGRTLTGKHGEAADETDEPFEITVSGLVHEVYGSLGTGAAVTVFDDDNDVPADFDYAWFWSDVDMYIQLIGATFHAILKVEAFVPFKLSGFDGLFTAANTTALSGAEPTLEDIDSIVIQNNSGGTGNYHFIVID